MTDNTLYQRNFNTVDIRVMIGDNGLTVKERPEAIPNKVRGRWNAGELWVRFLPVDFSQPIVYAIRLGANQLASFV